jgi:sugar lactone lactonase YvrE
VIASWETFQIILGLAGFLIAIYGVSTAASGMQKLMWTGISLACALIIASSAHVLATWIFVPAGIGWLALSIFLILTRIFSSAKSRVLPIAMCSALAMACLGTLVPNPHFLMHFVFELMQPRECRYEPASVHKIIRLPEETTELYESIVALPDGRFVVAASTRGELLTVTPDGHTSVLAKIPKGEFEFTLGGMRGLLGAIVSGKDGALYVSVNAIDPDNHGIWRVTLDGESERWIPLPVEASANGITVNENGDFYIADSAQSLVWKAPSEGGTAAAWYEDSPYGALNGLKFRNGQIYVTNTTRRRVARVEVTADGSAGAATLLSSGIGGDDFDIDPQGRIYVTTHPYNTILKLTSGEPCAVIADEREMIFGPTAAVFGSRPEDSHILYVVNDGGFSRPVKNGFPSIVALEVAQ